MKKIFGISGGSVGSDPMDIRTWSGSSRRFFSACERQGIIDRTLGVKATKLYKYYNALLSYSRDKTKWRTLFFTNPAYRSHMTKQLGKSLDGVRFENCCLLQLGAEFNSAQAVNGRTLCASYNDGNLVMASRSPYFPKEISRKQMGLAINFEKSVCRDMDKIFTMSHYLRKSFIDDYGVDPEKVICIGAGINLDCLPDTDYVKNYSNGEVVFIGVEFERKGGSFLLEAFKYVKEKVPYAKLNIIGPDSLPSSAPVDGVVFHGKLNRYEEEDAIKFQDIMKRSSLFVMPSTYEPFGIAPLEAMSYRIPCVVSDGWALPEIVLDRLCGELVPIKNSEVLSNIIIDLLKNPDKLKFYGENGRKHVESNFTWDCVASRLKMNLF